MGKLFYFTFKCTILTYYNNNLLLCLTNITDFLLIFFFKWFQFPFDIQIFDLLLELFLEATENDHHDEKSYSTWDYYRDHQQLHMSDLILEVFWVRIFAASIFWSLSPLLVMLDSNLLSLSAQMVLLDTSRRSTLPSIFLIFFSICSIFDSIFLTCLLMPSVITFTFLSISLISASIFFMSPLSFSMSTVLMTTPSARQAQGKNGNLKAILCSDCDHCWSQ